MFLSEVAHRSFCVKLGGVIRDGPSKKLWGGGRGCGGWEIFEPQEFFSLSNFLYEFFSGRSMNICGG